jgi:ceramide glucosyltransferase
VSILKPLKGLDDSLFDNFGSFCVQDYPEYEVIFSVQDENDPALKLARKIKAKHPQTDVSIVVERSSYGWNPKVNNLIHAYNIAKYPYIVVSDSNVRVDRCFLRDSIRHMENPDVGLVTNLIRASGGRTIGSVLENLHLNSSILGSVCAVSRFLKNPGVFGKSLLMRKRDFEAIGGYDAVRNILAEEYGIAQRIKEKGKRIILSNHIIDHVNKYATVGKLIERQTRWGKLRWQNTRVRYVLEILSNIIFISCLPVTLLQATKLNLCFTLIVMLLKVLGEYYVGRKIGSACRTIHYLLCPIKDMVMGFVWFVALFSRRIHWRGNRYRIAKDFSPSPCIPYSTEDVSDITCSSHVS